MGIKKINKTLENVYKKGGQGISREIYVSKSSPLLSTRGKSL